MIHDSPVLLLSACLFSIVGYYAYTLLSVPHSAHEPPLIKPKVPVVGHFIGMIRHGMSYYSKLSKKHKTDIYTLHFASKQAYILTSTRWIAAAHKNFRIISFDPVLDYLTDKLAGMSKEVVRDYTEHKTGPKLLKGMRPTLLPGALSGDLNAAVIAEIHTKLAELQRLEGKPVDIIRWLRDTIAIASTNAIYGPENPLKSEALREDFYIAESSFMLFIFSTPTVLARTAYDARARLAAAFTHYFSSGHAATGSAMARARLAIQLEDGHSLADIGRSEGTNLGGILANAIPTTFWMFFMLYSRPDLLARVRAEIDAVASTEDTGASFPASALKSRTPLLVATFQEVLRTKAAAASVRMLTADTSISALTASGEAESYLLKKGAFVLMPAETAHTETAQWGSNADTFDEKRFLEQSALDPHTEPRRRNPASFRSFGGGDHLCPGRHFAATEILAAVAMIVYRYDASPVDGKWVAPGADTSKVASAIAYPAGMFNVTLQERQGRGELRCIWDGDGGKGFRLVVG